MDSINLGWDNCRKCGKLTDRADLISGFCLDCTAHNVWKLRDQSEAYDAALQNGTPGFDEIVGRILREHYEAERQRMAIAFSCGNRPHKRWS